MMGGVDDVCHYAGGEVVLKVEVSIMKKGSNPGLLPFTKSLGVNLITFSS
jgi:hypothetical protein